MCADLSLTPSVRALDVDKPLILSFEDAAQFIDAYLPNMKVQDRRTAEISPVCNDLSNLGSALFICGTEDGLTDDTILMGAKWQLTGNEAIVKFVAGGCHGFMTFDGNRIDVTRQGWDILLQYLQLKLSTPNRGE
jgi:acetyl esterase/lipase